MREPSNARHWTRHFVYRTEHTRTTWKFRVVFVIVFVFVAWLTRGWWTVAIARSLVCEPSAATSDAILVENFDPPDYLAFERASRLRHAGISTRVIVPISIDPGTTHVNDVGLATAEVMAKIARLGAIDIVPVRQIEPISLNTARDVLRFVQQEGIQSVIVVSPLLRSKRSALVYRATLGRAGIHITCEPAHGPHDANTWTDSWHGIQNVMEQWFKLQYDRLYVLPFRSRELDGAEARGAESFRRSRQ